MVSQIVYTSLFEQAIKKLKDNPLKERIKKQIRKIVQNPSIGKPLKFSKKGERSIRIPPFRIIYAVQNTTLYFLNFDHRKKVYKK